MLLIPSTINRYLPRRKERAKQCNNNLKIEISERGKLSLALISLLVETIIFSSSSRRRDEKQQSTSSKDVDDRPLPPSMMRGDIVNYDEPDAAEEHLDDIYIDDPKPIRKKRTSYSDDEDNSPIRRTTTMRTHPALNILPNINSLSCQNIRMIKTMMSKSQRWSTTNLELEDNTINEF